jgi:hypothetical protein
MCLSQKPEIAKKISTVYASLDTFARRRKTIKGIGRGKVVEGSSRGKSHEEDYHVAVRFDFNEVSAETNNLD